MAGVNRNFTWYLRKDIWSRIVLLMNVMM